MQSGHGETRSDVGVEWVGAKGSWTFYILLLVAFRVFFGLGLSLSAQQSWTIINVVHASVTFLVFHWIKGNPFHTPWVDMAGKGEKQTWWEQIDGSVQNTPSRKFLVAVVVVLFLAAVHSTPFEREYLVAHLANVIAFTVVFVAKMPFMHGVRLFGINR
ncbi:hypothetical protein CDCA_CDCA03G1128 [Cyanidium caldarium]|uniref:Uncharacterized protein n=1 Tax=Cyanidium caldarium TaxID=2771 RepID=A0AAV9ISP5_CYACA|nr:hypothetical protein CDCA_CDCA03G1128 [Cyanidium caldarium]